MLNEQYIEFDDTYVFICFADSVGVFSRENTRKIISLPHQGWIPQFETAIAGTSWVPLAGSGRWRKSVMADVPVRRCPEPFRAPQRRGSEGFVAWVLPEVKEGH